MINRDAFFNSVRASLFGGALTQSQVDGLNATLDIWVLYSLGVGRVGSLLEGAPDPRHLSYVLATAGHETGFRHVPVRETFARFDYQAQANLGADYADPDPDSKEAYYGRGLVQLTHGTNYTAMGELTGVDLFAAPDIALGLWAGNVILLTGMVLGTFTGKKLSDYIDGEQCDYYNARRIVNGTDKAELIADYARDFEAALSGG